MRWVTLKMAFITTPLFTRILTQPRATSCSPITRFRLRTATTMRMSSGAASDAAAANGKVPEGKDVKSMSDADWRSVLSAQEYNVIRDKGTEYPGTGQYDGFYPAEGHFVCAACGNALYSAESKFKSGCGWPAFDKCYKGSIAVEKDLSLGGVRIEILCAKCDGHLGHVFEGERMTETNQRHCVNSVSVKYVKGVNDQEQVKVL